MTGFDIKFKRTLPNAKVPTRGNPLDAGYDLYSTETYTMAPGEVHKFDTGIQFELLEGTFAGIFARSGLATKHGLRPSNCVGVCDSPFRHNYVVALYNDSTEPYTVEEGERIAQMIVLPYIPVNLVEADDLSETDRGEGFGSSGKF